MTGPNDAIHYITVTVTREREPVVRHAIRVLDPENVQDGLVAATQVVQKMLADRGYETSEPLGLTPGSHRAPETP